MSGVAVVKTADSGKRCDLPWLGHFHRTSCGRILPECEVGSILVVVSDDVAKQLTGVSFIPEDDVIEALSP